MAGTNSRKAPISIFLVAIMVTSVFAGVSFTFPTAAAFGATATGPSLSEPINIGDDVTFTVDLSYSGTEGVNQEPTCTYTLVAPEGSPTTDITGSVTGTNGDCPSRPLGENSGSTDITYALTRSHLDAVGGDTQQDGYTILVEATLDGNTDTAQSAPFAIDTIAPDLKDAQQSIDDPGISTALEFDSVSGAFVGGGDYNFTLEAASEAFPELWEVVDCSSSPSQVAAPVPHTTAGDAVRIDGVQRTNFTGLSDGTFDVQVRLTDQAGNVGTSSCVEVSFDVTEPALIDVRDLTAGFVEGTVEFTSGEDFNATDDESGLTEVVLEWTGPDPGVSSDTNLADGVNVAFPTEEHQDGAYTLTLGATDAVGNTATHQQTVRVDNNDPLLRRVTVDDDGPCDPVDLVRDGETEAATTLCPGPYTIEIVITEKFPAAAPGLEGAFVSSQSQTPARAGPNQERLTYTFSGEELATAGPEYAFNVTFTDQAGNSFSNLANATDILFTLSDLPQAKFSPQKTIFEDEPVRYTVSHVRPSACTQANLAANEFCTPGNVTPSAVKLVDASGTVFSTFTEKDDTNTPATEYTTTRNPSSSQLKRLSIRVESGSDVGQSPSSALIVIDRSTPAFSNLDLHEWDPTTRGWQATTGDAEIPAEGLYLVELTYDSYSARQIKFRFIDETTADDAAGDQTYVEYSFQVATSGNNAGAAHATVGEVTQVTHLAKHVPLSVSGSRQLTSGTGCDAPDGNERPLWGTERTCYFLIELDNPSATQGTSGLQTGTDYVVQPIIVESSSESGQQSDDALTPVAPTTSFTSADLDPAVPEVGVSNQFSLELSDTEASSESDFKEIDVWVCAILPGDEENPDPNVDQAYAGYPVFTGSHQGDLLAIDRDPHCDAVEHPIHASDENDALVEARKMATIPAAQNQEDGAVRVLNFTLNNINDGVDRLYFKLLVRDQAGNLAEHYLLGEDPGPGVFDIADYDVSPALVQVSDEPAGSGSTAPFNGDEGCFQPTQQGGTTRGNLTSNTLTNPCYRQLQLLSPYDPIEIPLLIENDGNVADDVVVTWEHREGQSNWDVELVNPGDPTTAEDDEVQDKRLVVPIDEPQFTTQPEQRRVLVRIHPAADALGGESKTINLTVFSGGSESSSNPHKQVYLKAKLSPITRARMALDGSLDPIHRELSPGDETQIPFTINNTGNTERPLKLAIDRGRLCAFNTADEDKIQLTWQTSQGTTITQRVISPGQEEEFLLGVEIGDEVSASDTSSYRCIFDLLADLDGNGQLDNPIRTTPLEPRLNIDVTGIPNMRILELRGAGRDEVDVTGNEITRVVPPTADAATVTLYLENIGNLSVEPELTVTEDTSQNAFGLQGDWRGLTRSGAVPIDQVDQPFTLGISDLEDEFRIKDMVDPDGTEAPGVAKSTDSQWDCYAGDGDVPADDDDRRICRVQFTYPLDGLNAISGDEVVHTFSWQDPATDAGATSVTVRLIVDHIGHVSVEDVTNKVTTSDATVRFNASLFEGHRFDLETQSSVEAEDLRFINGAGDEVCSDSSWGLPQDDSPSETRAFFDVPVAFSDSQSCSLSSSGYQLPDSTGTYQVWLTVADENGTLLRSVQPAQIHHTSAGSTDRPDRATNLAQGPADEMDANGTQYATFGFDDRIDPDSPGNKSLEGILLSRETGQSALEPHLACSGGDPFFAASTGSIAGSSWSRIAAEGAGGSLADNNNDDHKPLAPEKYSPGKLLRQVGSGANKRAEPVGNVAIYGWGTGGEDPSLAWQVGLNPVVFHIEDLPDQTGEPGDPAKNAVNPSLEMRFLAVHDADDDEANENSRYEWTNIPLRKLGNGYYAADIYLPEQLADASLGDHPTNPSQATQHNWSMKLSVSSGESRGGEDLRGDAFWRLSDLGLDGTLSTPDGTDRTVASTDLEGSTSGSIDDQRFTRTHAVARFLPGLTTEGWATGPGIHSMGFYAYEERISREQDGKTLHNGPMAEEINNFREHTFTPKTDLTPRFTFLPSSRSLAQAGDTVRLAHADENARQGHYDGNVFLRDLGRDTADWSVLLTVSDNQGDQILELLRGGSLTVEANREPATNGLPMPLCIQKPAWAQPTVADVFEEQDLSSSTTLDLRAIPGLLLDRGDFSLTPFLTARDGDLQGVRHDEQEGDLQGVRHDEQETFNIRGEGLVSLTASDIPAEAEVDVPIPISASVSGPVAKVTAKLVKGGETVESTRLTEAEDGLYEGQLTPVALGTHQLTITAEDIVGGVDVVEKTIEVKENVPPRVTVTRPVEFDGIRAMQPDSTVEAKITNGLIAPEHITLLEKTGGSGDGVSGSALAESDGVEITGIQDTVAPGSFDLVVNMSQALADGGHLSADSYGWLNVTDSDGNPVDSYEGALEQGGFLNGSISLSDAGTYTLRAVGNNTTAAQEFVNTTFSVTVQDTGGDFSEVSTDDYEVTCEATTCTVRYAPTGLSGGQTLTLRYDVEVTPEDATVNDTVIVLDSLAPEPEITLSSPSSGTTISPATLIEVSAGDNTGIKELTVSGVAGGTELGNRTVTGDSGEVSARVLGLTDDGSATIRLTAIDIAGNSKSITRSVEVDGTGPALSDATAARTNGDLVVRVTAEDDAGVDSVELFFKRPGADSFTNAGFQAGESGDRWSVTVSDVGDTGAFRYYIEATDALQNQATLGSAGNPETVDLGDVPIDTNTAPEVAITSPSSGDRVSGVINVTWEISDAEGDSVTISGVQASPAVGQALSLTAADGQATLDTTQLPEGGLTITVDASDGTATGSDTVQVIVDNLAPAPTCDPDAQAEAGQEFEVCFELETEPSVTQIELQYVRNGEVVVSKTLEPSEDGQYQTTVTFPEAGTYTPKVVKTYEDGSTEETTFETQSVAEALSDKPLATFVGMLVVAIAVLAVAGYAAFGRWN